MKIYMYRGLISIICFCIVSMICVVIGVHLERVASCTHAKWYYIECVDERYEILVNILIDNFMVSFMYVVYLLLKLRSRYLVEKEGI
ncbi:MAG: hypothetical protein ACFFCS_16165 [Candidatus Hodarchaeota archaeon]